MVAEHSLFQVFRLLKAFGGAGFLESVWNMLCISERVCSGGGGLRESITRENGIKSGQIGVPRLVIAMLKPR